MSILGDRIKKEREILDITREELAKKIGVSYSAVAMYEQGNREPSNELILKMCKIFNCTLDYLMGQTNYKTPEENLTQYNINQSKTLILKTIDRYYYEYVVPCSLSEKDVDTLVDILSNVNKRNIDDAKEQLTMYINSFDSSKRRKIRELIDIIIREQIEDLKSKDRLIYLTNLVHDTNKKVLNDQTNIYMVPVYGKISAGQPNWAEENIECHIPVPMTNEISDPENCFYLKVNGESMNLLVKNGAYALIHKQDIVDDGDVAVVLVNGYDATLKKFGKQGDFVVLEPMSSVTDDPEIKTQIYDKKTSIKILGKYIGKFELNK